MSEQVQAESKDESLPHLDEREPQPRYRVGTHFIETVPGRGEREGVVTDYYGGSYTIYYQELDEKEHHTDTKVLDAATITTNWDTHLLETGQHVRGYIRKGWHPAQIKSIDKSEGKATIRWDSGGIEVVDLRSLFSHDDFGRNASSRSKRKRMPTNFFINGKDRPVAAILKKQQKKECVTKQELQDDSGFQGQKKERNDAVMMKDDAKKPAAAGNDAIKMEDESCMKPPAICKQEAKTHNPSKKKPKRKDNATKSRSSKVKKRHKFNTSELPSKQKSATQLSSKRKCEPNAFELPVKHESALKAEAPGPGWKRQDNDWLSPGLGLRFDPFQACKFEAFRREHSGDEVEAYQKYQKYFGESLDNTNTKSEEQHVKGEGENNLDVNSISELQRKEYNMLWEYYLNPKVRKDEEIPSGMVIRQKIAQCSLLRSKCEFRRAVYKQVEALNRSNKRVEIYQILKQLHDHDISGRTGRGPPKLLEEILGTEETQMNEEAECIEPSHPKISNKVENVDDIAMSLNCDHTAISSITESLPPSAFARAKSPFIQSIGDNASFECVDEDEDDAIKLVDFLDENVVGKSPPSDLGDEKPPSLDAVNNNDGLCGRSSPQIKLNDQLQQSDEAEGAPASKVSVAKSASIGAVVPNNDVYGIATTEKKSIQKGASLDNAIDLSGDDNTTCGINNQSNVYDAPTPVRQPKKGEECDVIELSDDDDASSSSSLIDLTEDIDDCKPPAQNQRNDDDYV